MDVFDRLQSGLFFHPTLIDFTPTIPQPHILSDKAQPTVNYVDSASSGIPIPPPFPINSPPSPEVPLPLLSVSADVDVHGRLCTTKVTQQFSNAFSSTSQNVKYVFPIYDGSVVTSFRCWIGNDKLLEGAVKTKEAARADFKHAVSQRKVAVLVEELTPEVFETSVGNIPAQTTVKVEITYANLLKVDNSTGGLVLTIPTSIAPRYGILPPGYSGNQSLLTEGLRINVQVSMPAAIRKMESRSHPISVEMGAVFHKSFENFAAGASSDTVDYSRGQATLSDRNAVLHQDFVLHILCSSREPSQSRAIAATQPGSPALSTIAVTIHPGDLFRQRVDVGDFVGEIIFMADRSGSMRPKITSLINVMNVFLRSLPESCSFNIASFGSDVTWLWPSSKRYSQENLDVASKHVDSFQANYGGTDIYRALQSVLDHFNRQNDVPTSVILLTDGEVWDVGNVIQLVRRTVSVGDSNIRFFSLGIGDRVSHRLVEGIGQQGGGYAEIVPESSMGSWQERVIQMLKAALTPSRLQCNVDVGNDLTMKTSEREIAGYTVQYPECVQAPHHIPVLNTFSHFSLYYMLESGMGSLPKTINITATTDKGEKLTAQLPIQMVVDQSAIHHLAAKALMNDYETGQSWLHSLNADLKSSNPTGFEEVLMHEAEHLGQRWSIPSRWTSYVAIDRTTAQHHAISVHKPEAIEVSQLTRPRYTSPYTPRRFKSGQSRPAPILWDNGSGESTAHATRHQPMFCLGPSADSAPMRNNSSSLNSQTADMSTSLEYTNFFDSLDGKLPSMSDSSLTSLDHNFAPPSEPSGPGAGTPKMEDLHATQDEGDHMTLNMFSDSAESGRDSRTATPQVAYTIPDEDGELASGVQSSRGAVVEVSQPQLLPLAASSMKTTARGRPSSDLDKSRSDSPHSSIDESQLMRNISSNDREVRDLALTPPSEFPPLETILRAQQADGEFSFLGRLFSRALREKYHRNALEEFLNSRFHRRSQATRWRLIDNIITVVYITHEHAASKALWELQVGKAQQWIKRTIMELLKSGGDAEETPETSLEVLVESILGEMEKRALQET